MHLVLLLMSLVLLNLQEKILLVNGITYSCKLGSVYDAECSMADDKL